jgi:hypothetical protein
MDTSNVQPIDPRGDARMEADRNVAQHSNTLSYDDDLQYVHSCKAECKRTFDH